MLYISLQKDIDIDAYGELTMNKGRAALRRFAIINGITLMAFWVVMIIIYPHRLGRVPAWNWVLLTIPIAIMIASIVDALGVYYYVRKLQPIMRLDGAQQAFIRGTTWKELRAAVASAGPVLGVHDFLIAHASEVKQKRYREPLLANIDSALQSRELARIRTDVPVDFDRETLRYRGVSRERPRPRHFPGLRPHRR